MLCDRQCCGMQEDWPVCLFLLILEGSECVLQAVCEYLQLLREFVLFSKLLSQQHQVTCGIMKWDVTQVQASPCQVVQVHYTEKCG